MLISNHRIFTVSRQFRKEVATYYYANNTFACKSLWNVERHIRMAFPSIFRNSLTSLVLIWTSLGESTIQAENVLTSLPYLRFLNIYISWQQALGAPIPYSDRTIEENTRAGIESFRRLLVMKNSEGPVQVNVFQFSLFSFKILSERDSSRDEFIINEIVTYRLIPYGDADFLYPLHGHRNDVKLMTRVQIDEKLDEVLVAIIAEEAKKEATKEEVAKYAIKIKEDSKRAKRFQEYVRAMEILEAEEAQQG